MYPNTSIFALCYEEKRKIYERFLLEVLRDKFEVLQHVMMNIPTDSSAVDEGHLENPIKFVTYSDI